jgi:hypothetical protein
MTVTDIDLPAPKKRARRKPAAAAKSTPAPKKRRVARKAAPGPAAKATPAPKTSEPQVWTAQFIYAAADGSAHMSLMTITAATAEAAREVAAAHAPAQEFMVTVHPRSDEQFLGQVRMKALSAVRNH